MQFSFAQIRPEKWQWRGGGGRDLQLAAFELRPEELTEVGVQAVGTGKLG